MSSIGNALAAVLKAQRGDFNHRFKLAQQQYRALTAEAWYAFIADTLNPVAEIIAAHNEDAVSEVINVLYDQALPLVAKQWLGSAPREPVLAACYKQLLAMLAPVLVREPERVSAALLNALHQLCALDSHSPNSPNRAREWTQRMAAILKPVAASASVEQTLALGRVIAWRVGLAALREAALRDAPTLPADWVRQALDIPFTPDATLWDTLNRNPAMRAEEKEPPRQPEWLGWTGGFRGLGKSGGPFAALPSIGLAGGRLAASDGNHTWWLAADGYGQQAVRMGAAADWPLEAGTPVKVSESGAITLAGKTHSFAELETARGALWHSGILAVVLRTSYQVALLRCPQPR